jgi:hypothetical protein
MMEMSTDAQTNVAEKISIKKGSVFPTINVEFKKILRAIYCWVYSYTNYQAINLYEISEKNLY